MLQRFATKLRIRRIDSSTTLQVQPNGLRALHDLLSVVRWHIVPQAAEVAGMGVASLLTQPLNLSREGVYALLLSGDQGVQCVEQVV